MAGFVVERGKYLKIMGYRFSCSMNEFKTLVLCGFIFL